jgi:hypothetical protein
MKTITGRDIRGCTKRTGDFKCREVKLDFAEIDQRKPVLLGLSLAGNLIKPLLSLYRTEWRPFEGAWVRTREERYSSTL